MSKFRLYLLITIALGLVIIVAGFVVTEMIGRELDDELVAYYGEQEKLIAANIARTFEAEFAGIERQLILMGQQPDIFDGSEIACANTLRTLLARINSRLGNVGRVGEDGRFTCSLNPALVGTEAAALGTYITDIFTDIEHKSVMSRAIQVPGAQGHLVALHVPVIDAGGVFRGTLGGALYLSELHGKYLENVTFAERGYVVLLDDDATILYHQDKTRIGTKIGQQSSLTSATEAFTRILEQSKRGESGTFVYESTTDGEKVAAFYPAEVVPGRIWTVVVTVPVSDVRNELIGLGVNQLLTIAWAIIATVVALGVAGFVLVTRVYIFKPIREVEQMKSDFVSLVSHQLKTPVAQIKGYVENMLDGLAGAITPKEKEYLNDMLTVANKNSKLIDDLLNVSRIERGLLKLNPETLSIGALMEDVLAPLRAVAAAKGVTLTERKPEADVSIRGDAVKTREAVRNIVDNAIKFSTSGMAVTVEGRAADGFGELAITDQGPGIDANVETELFKKDRVWAGKVKASGAGLGLFLSKKFIELSGGTITYTTAPGKGTTFVIKLPKA